MRKYLVNAPISTAVILTTLGVKNIQHFNDETQQTNK